MKTFITSIFTLLSIICFAQDSTMNHNNHNHHMNHKMEHSETHNGHLFSTAPIGVMGDHMHHKGSLMFSYRTMFMLMDGNLNGSSEVRNADIYKNHMVAPQSMFMGMHMLSSMYAVSDKFTGMVMVNFLTNGMNLQPMMRQEFHTHSIGLGDISVSTMFRLISTTNNKLHTQLGVSLPTGSINVKHEMMNGTMAKVAYPMQLGSGTYDPFIGVTYNNENANFSWGLQANYMFRGGKNSELYTLGNVINSTAWGVLKASDKVNFTARVAYNKQDEVIGQDADFNPMMMPLFNSNNTGREDIATYGGVNYFVTNGKLKGLKIGFEAGLPVYQKVNGTQMKQSLNLVGGLQYTI